MSVLEKIIQIIFISAENSPPQHSKDSASQRCLSTGAMEVFLYSPAESQPHTFAKLQTSTFSVSFGGFAQLVGSDIKLS